MENYVLQFLRSWQLQCGSLLLVCTTLLYMPLPKLQYYIKLLIIYIGFAYMGVLLSIYGIFHKTFETSRFAKKLLDPIGFLLGIHFTVKGIENINREVPYIIICNHQHALDIITAMQIWDKFDKAAVTAKKELKWLGFFGIALQMAGTIFIERGHQSKAKATLNKAVQHAKSQNTSIFVFPEGTRHLRSSDGVSMLPFKKGAFHMAINAGLPILPIVISEYDFIDQRHKIFGECKGSVLRKASFKFRPQVSVNVLNPIATSGLTSHNIEQLMEETRNKMISEFEDCRKKKYIMNILEDIIYDLF